MELNPFNWSLNFVGGMFTIIVAIVFTAASVFLYSGPFIMNEHVMGDLGNPELNPVGYILYNFGLILSGLSLIVFMLGMNKWRMPMLNERWFDYAQVSGIVSGIGLVINGNIQESATLLSVFWYSVFFVLVFVSILIFNMQLQKHPKFINGIAYFGYIVNFVISILFLLTLSNIFTDATLALTRLFMWLSCGLVLVWIALIVINTIYLHRSAEPKAEDSKAK